MRSRLFTLIPYILPLIILAPIIYRSLKIPFVLQGDSIEYIIQTQAIVFDRSLSINPETRGEYWNQTNPFNRALTKTNPPIFNLSEEYQAGGGFGSLYTGKNLLFYYVHSWVFSLVVAPLYFAFHLIGNLIGSNTFEYYSFFVANLVFLIMPFFTVFFYLRDKINSKECLFKTGAVFAILLCCPLAGYLNWQHTELFQFGLISTAFIVVFFRESVFIPISLLSLAVAQNLPSVLFFAPLLYLLWQKKIIGQYQQCKRNFFVSLALSGAIGGVVIATPPILNHLNFDTFNLIEQIGFAKLEYATLLRMADFFLNPFQGAIWFYPALFIGYVMCLVVKDRSKDFACDTPELTFSFKLLVLIAVFAVAYLTTATSNLRSAQVAAVRYSVWVLAPMFSVVLYSFCRECCYKTSCRGRSFATFLFCVLSLILVYSLNTKSFLLEKPSCFERLKIPHFTPALIKLIGYKGDPEIFAESIGKVDLYLPHQFDSYYEYKDAWVTLVSKRFYNRECLDQKRGLLCDRVAASPEFKKQPFLGEYIYIGPPSK